MKHILYSMRQKRKRKCARCQGVISLKKKIQKRGEFQPKDISDVGKKGDAVEKAHKKRRKGCYEASIPTSVPRMYRDFESDCSFVYGKRNVCDISENHGRGNGGGTNGRPSAEAEARVSFSPFPEGKNMGIGGRWLVDTRGGKRREFTNFYFFLFKK